MDLSVIITTTRPKWLPNILEQYRNQSISNVRLEPTVVVQCEDDEYPEFVRTTEFFSIGCHRLPIAHDWGGASRNYGIGIARGEYVCFWDDDVIYYQHALATLYATAYGYDVGFVSSLVRNYREGYVRVPQDPITEYGPNTMCFCVRTVIARRVEWPIDSMRHCDTRWMEKVLKLEPTPTHRTVPVVIGVGL